MRQPHVKSSKTEMYAKHHKIPEILCRISSRLLFQDCLSSAIARLKLVDLRLIVNVGAVPKVVVSDRLHHAGKEAFNYPGRNLFY